MTKKLLGMALVAAMAISLVGCGSTDTTSGTKTDNVTSTAASEAVEKGVRVFIDWLKSGKLEMRMYTAAPIHAKVYIMRKDPVKVPDTYGSVITGSSNFSEAGLINNLEFNVELKDTPDVKFALDRFEALWENGITALILPEFDKCMDFPQSNPHHSYTVGRHILRSLSFINRENLDKYRDILPSGKEDDTLRLLRFTMLLHDIGKCECRSVDEEGIDHFHGHAAVSEKLAIDVLKRLKSDNRSIDLISRLVRHHDYRPDSDIRNVRRAINRIGEDIFPLLFPVRYADILAQSEYKRQEKLNKERDLYLLYREILEKDQCLSIKDLKIDGRTLISEAGMKSGKELGDMLKYLLEQVLEEPSWNEREKLLTMAKEKLLQEKKKTE